MTVNYGADIRAERLARGWTRQRLAEESGYTTSQIAAVESGQPVDPAPVLEALQLHDVHLVTSSLNAHFLRVVQDIIRRIDRDRVPLVLSDIMSVISHEAAGVEVPAVVQQFNVVTGDATVEQTNLDNPGS